MASWALSHPLSYPLFDVFCNVSRQRSEWGPKWENPGWDRQHGPIKLFFSTQGLPTSQAIGYWLLAMAIDHGYWLLPRLSAIEHWLSLSSHWLLGVGHQLLTTNIGYWLFAVESSKASHINMPPIIKLQKFLKNKIKIENSFNQLRMDCNFFSIY